MTTFLLAIAVIAIAMLAMGVGVVFSNRCLRGSCGGPEVLGPDGTPLSCETCPLRNSPECEHEDAHEQAG
jgi:hypothetical protein